MPADETRLRPTREEPPAPAAAPARHGCLVFVEGEAALGRVVVLSDEVVLGRDPSASVPLPGEDVSRRHARVAPDGDGHVVVDLGSTNGTWIELERIEQHQLGNQQEFRIGSHVLMFIVTDVE